MRPLSKGGMALVFEARRESLAGVAPRVAIKLILPEHKESDTFQELFINEARLGASMHHQNLVQIQDFDRDGDHFFLVMEYVEGLTLRQAVAECVRHDIQIPVGVIAEIGRQACDGLHYAHQATDERGVHLGLIHRDVKPSNLMLNPHGVVKILDFGISKGNLLSERSGAVRGTWGYMAPEQAHGRGIEANADVFGLATILYEMASRKPLFRKKSPDEIKRLLEDDHAARMAATLPAEYGPLVGVLVRALQRDPAARYLSGADFGRALSSLLPDPITARDEVTRFYKRIAALEQGKPVPVEAVSARSQATGSHGLDLPGPAALSGPSHASLVAADTTSSGGGSTWPWIAVGVAVLLAMCVGGVFIGAWVFAPVSDGRGIVLDMDEVDGVTPILASDPLTDGSDEGVAAADTDAAGQADPVDDADGASQTPDPPEITRPEVGRPPPARSVGAEPQPVDGDPVRPARITPDGSSETDPDVDTEPDTEAPVVVRIDRTTPPDGGAEGTADGSETDGSGDGGSSEPVVTEPDPPEPVAAGVGWITLSAQPYGLDYDVFIDGKLVRKSGPKAPVIRHELPTGEHFVTISAAGGGRKQFEITIEPDDHVRKVWDFDRNSWRR